MKKILQHATAAVLAIALGPAAHAHGFWFAQRANQFAMVFGVGADDLDMAKRMPKVTSFNAYDEDGKEVASKLTPAGQMVFVDIDNQPAIVAAAMDYGMWTKTPDGKWFNKGKDEVPNAVIAEKNYKYGVAIRRDLGKPMPLLPTQTLQILPMVDKLPAKMGQPLKLKVVYKGKPAAGAKILTDWVNDPDAKPVKTAKDGTVTIKVRNQGLNVIVAVFNSPPEDPAKTNTVENLASLSFVLPHEPE